MPELNLYIILLGGKHDKANVEVHDVVPVISSDIESAFPYLKEQWFGRQKGLHVDGWMKINGVSYQGTNYQVQITDTLANTDLKLFLINLGAYLPDQFGEIHKYLVVAAKNKTEAKAQGKLAIEKTWFKPHADAVIDVDDCLELNKIDQKFVHLVEGDFEANSFKNDYLIIP
ncbi:hypothetical protein BS636_15120 [Acinetobacter sp. LoGeW2-3]|uniref:DUF1543 domain-containing protein n=1 Tax=Acinetobacter sp. LoGeW2-3 TaxID=1808001 RepID=UPI000C05A32E|nr:DUF1543 domain-containing protein [Acinetobacter sp. LoGeW2-3]ATO20913.1 hypothetical protein BS636_15120 [Acinetobacter sp. LoGeW2-3]